MKTPNFKIIKKWFPQHISLKYQKYQKIKTLKIHPTHKNSIYTLVQKEASLREISNKTKMFSPSARRWQQKVTDRFP